MPGKRKVIEFKDLKEIKLQREKGNQLTINFLFIDHDKKKRLALPFSNNEIKDLYYMISDLKSKIDDISYNNNSG